jgi:ABC-type glycerol-3-phosphate transport system substrate-binding protein
VQYAVLHQSKHQELAKAFVKFLATNPGVQDRVYAATGNLPAYLPSLNKLETTADPATKQFIEELKNNELGGLPGWVHNPQKIWAAYDDMLTQLFTTNTPVPQLLQTEQTQALAAAQG